MSPKLVDLLVFVLIALAGWQLVAFIGRNSKRKHRLDPLSYLFFMAGPILATIYAYSRVGRSVIYMFLLASVIGLYFEYSIDKSWMQLFGRRLWRYYRADIQADTSWLVVPLWGAGGVLFLLLARLFIS